MTYHNTTNESGQQLRLYQKAAMNQDTKIIELIKFYRLEKFSPKDINLLYPVAGTPITSIRRSINTLTKRGELTKTDEKVPGIYGRPEHVWRVNN